MAELTASIPQAGEFDAEDKRQMLECLLEAIPDVNLIDPSISMARNIGNADSIKDLVNGLVDSYCTNPNCLDPDVVGELMSVFKDAYETLLKFQAESDTEEQVEC